MPPSYGGELSGLTAVISGSSSGIGRAIALELARAGAACVVHGHRNGAGAEETASQVRALGAEALVVLSNVAVEVGQQSLADAAWKWRGAVDVVVANAGADVLTGDAARWSFEKKLDVLWRVDVAGAMGLARRLGARMKERGRGAIVHIGWSGADLGMAGDSGELFAATKAAVMAFTKSQAASLAPEVRVNCVAPGWIKTAWGKGASDYWQDRAVREALLGRWGTPEDIAHAVRFLASPVAGFITGQILAVDGGLRPGRV